MTPPRTELTLTDPRALRALAHPARQRVVSALYAGESLTATQAARLCGLSPSAMSYHLRALETWGIVRRGESEDGRERPWVSAADDFSIPPAAYEGIPDALGAQLMALWGNEIGRALARAAGGEGGLHELSTARRSRLWITPEETAALNAAISEVLDGFGGRTSREHPEGAVPMDGYILLLPADPEALEAR